MAFTYTDAHGERWRRTGSGQLPASVRSSSRRSSTFASTLDDDAHRHVVDEHGDCADCLIDTMEALSDAARALLIRRGPRCPSLIATVS